jgi:hypothetical protein
MPRVSGPSAREHQAMTENLTERTSAEEPARADSDEQTHLVDAAPVDVVANTRS